MARKTTKTVNAGFRQADAFLRLSVVDDQGNEHRLPKDLALSVQNHISSNMINKAEDDSEYKFSLVGTVHVVDNSPKEDVSFT